MTTETTQKVNLKCSFMKVDDVLAYLTKIGISDWKKPFRFTEYALGETPGFMFCEQIKERMTVQEFRAMECEVSQFIIL